jgi:hypothetical protein
MKKVLSLITIIALSSFTFASQANVSLEKASQNELKVVLNSDSDIYGLQFDLNYDSQEIRLSEESINHMFTSNDIRSNMSVYSKIKEPGLARVIMFDLNGQPIIASNNSENVLSLSYDNVSTSARFSVSVSNVVAAGLHGEEVSVEVNDVFDFTSDGSGALPGETQLHENFPNPFNPITNISFDLADANQGNVNISIFDMTGREVANVHNGWLASGYHQFAWDAGNVASGNYFAIISAPGFTDRIKMTLIK